MKRPSLRKTRYLLSAALLVLSFAGTILAEDRGKGSSFERFPEELREKIKYVIIIYPENRSFDSLYGSFPGANGLQNASVENETQVAPSGTPLATLPQPNTNGIPGISNGPDPRFGASLPNQPFDIGPNVPLTDRHGDLTHKFYLEQYQINNPDYRVGQDPKSAGGAPLTKFSTFSSNAGLVLGHYDAQNSAEGLLAKQYALCDNAFHSAFGGSFLNHQWLIAARTPVWPANPAEGNPPSLSSATVFDSNGFPVFTSSGTVSDGVTTNDPNLTGFDHSNANQNLQSGDYWAINTVFPLRGPAGGLNTIDPTPPPPGPVTQPTSPTFNTALASRLPLQYHDTIGDRLSEANLSWAWYAGGWNDAKAGVANYLFQFHHQPFAFFAKYALAQSPVPATGSSPAVPGVDSPGSKAHLKDIDADFFSDLQNGTLPRVSFVKPIGQDNQHPGYASVQEGAQWLRDTVQKIQASRYWNRCAIFVMYDEHGGLWDHVVPPEVDDWGPGLRVPLTVISPFAKNGFVDHSQYETVSLLKFVEELYKLPPLNSRDANALAPIASFRGQPDLIVKAEAGDKFVYKLPAYNNPKFFIVVGDLDGLALNPFNGDLSGYPRRVGHFSSLVIALGGNGASPVFYSLQLRVSPDDDRLVLR